MNKVWRLDFLLEMFRVLSLHIWKSQFYRPRYKRIYTYIRSWAHLERNSVLDMMWYDTIRYDIFVNFSWVDTSWQYSTHLHTDNTQNNTMKQNAHNGTSIITRIRNCKNMCDRKMFRTGHVQKWNSALLRWGIPVVFSIINQMYACFQSNTIFII
jgi:hypothetical protein